MQLKPRVSTEWGFVQIDDDVLGWFWKVQETDKYS